MILSNDVSYFYILITNGLYKMHLGVSAHGVNGAVRKHYRDGRSLVHWDCVTQLSSQQMILCRAMFQVPSSKTHPCLLTYCMLRSTYNSNRLSAVILYPE